MPDSVLLVLARDAGLTSGLRRLLEAEGFTVRTGHRYDEGSGQRWPGEDLAAVLVDAGLLVDDPFTELARLRLAFPGALLVVMAGRPDHPVVEAAVGEGALPLTADFDLHELVRTLGGDDGLSGVREPRRPRAPAGPAAAFLQPPVP